jgi:hypothetical protein
MHGSGQRWFQKNNTKGVNVSIRLFFSLKKKREALLQRLPFALLRFSKELPFDYPVKVTYLPRRLSTVCGIVLACANIAVPDCNRIWLRVNWVVS